MRRACGLLLGRALTDPSNEVVKVMGEIFSESADLFFSLLRRVSPNVDHSEFYWRANCVVGAFTFAESYTDRLTQFIDEDLSDIDWTAAANYVVRFLAAGMRAPASSNAPADRSLARGPQEPASAGCNRAGGLPADSCLRRDMAADSSNIRDRALSNPLIDLFFWPTGNGKKISIMLEEVGLPYRIVPVNINKGDQFAPEYDAINPNNKMPAIVDPDAAGGTLVVFESGAILQYLAEKTGKLLPTDLHGKYRVLQWVYWQVGRPRTDGGPGASLPQVRAPESRIRHASIPIRDCAPIQGDGQAIGQARVSRGRVFDRGHRRLALGRPARLAGTEPR